jgi:aminopeptidase C
METNSSGHIASHGTCNLYGSNSKKLTISYHRLLNQDCEVIRTLQFQLDTSVKSLNSTKDAMLEGILILMTMILVFLSSSFEM